MFEGVQSETLCALAYSQIDISSCVDARLLYVKKAGLLKGFEGALQARSSHTALSTRYLRMANRRSHSVYWELVGGCEFLLEVQGVLHELLL